MMERAGHGLMLVAQQLPVHRQRLTFDGFGLFQIGWAGSNRQVVSDVGHSRGARLPAASYTSPRHHALSPQLLQIPQARYKLRRLCRATLPRHRADLSSLCRRARPFCPGSRAASSCRGPARPIGPTPLSMSVRNCATCPLLLASRLLCVPRSGLLRRRPADANALVRVRRRRRALAGLLFLEEHPRRNAQPDDERSEHCAAGREGELVPAEASGRERDCSGTGGAGALLRCRWMSFARPLAVS